MLQIITKFSLQCFRSFELPAKSTLTLADRKAPKRTELEDKERKFVKRISCLVSFCPEIKRAKVKFFKSNE